MTTTKLTAEELEILVAERNEKEFEHTVEVMNIDQLTKYRNNCLEAIERQETRIAKAKTGGVVQESAIEIKEVLEGYVAYIDSKIAETKEVKGFAVIDQFLQQWKEKCFDYYVHMIEQLKAIDNSDLSRKEKALKRNTFLFRLTKAEAVKIGSYGYKRDYKKWVEHDLDFEVQNKRLVFMQRITKKAGEIIDAANLRLGDNGEINGKIIGDKETVTVKTISAGGYNIQCFHYRMIVK